MVVYALRTTGTASQKWDTTQRNPWKRPCLKREWCPESAECCGDKERNASNFFHYKCSLFSYNIFWSFVNFIHHTLSYSLTLSHSPTHSLTHSHSRNSSYLHSLCPYPNLSNHEENQHQQQQALFRRLHFTTEESPLQENDLHRSVHLPQQMPLHSRCKNHESPR